MVRVSTQTRLPRRISANNTDNWGKSSPSESAMNSVEVALTSDNVTVRDLMVTSPASAGMAIGTPNSRRDHPRATRRSYDHQKPTRKGFSIAGAPSVALPGWRRWQ